MLACICGALKRLLGFEFPGESFWSCDQNNGLHMTWLTASLQATLEATNVGTATGKALAGYAFRSFCTKNNADGVRSSRKHHAIPRDQVRLAGWVSNTVLLGFEGHIIADFDAWTCSEQCPLVTQRGWCWAMVKTIAVCLKSVQGRGWPQGPDSSFFDCSQEAWWSCTWMEGFAENWFDDTCLMALLFKTHDRDVYVLFVTVCSAWVLGAAIRLSAEFAGLRA